MATFLSPDHMTLSEALELQRWNGDYSLLRGMERRSNIMRILPWFETSDGDFHKGAKVTELPEGDFGAINKPLPTGKAATTEYTEKVGIYELKSDVDERILKGRSIEKAKKIREGRDRTYLMGFLQGFSKQLVNCNGVAADTVKGIIPRRPKIDNKYCFDMGGTSGNLGSILFLRPGEDGICLRYPDNDAPNFSMEDMGRVNLLAYDKTGKVIGDFPGYRTLARLYYTIDIADDNAVVRVANVPTTTAMTDENIDALIDIVNNNLEDSGTGYVAFAPKQIISQFQKYLKDKANISFTRGEIEGMGKPTELLGIPFFHEEFMDNAETKVTA